MRRGRRAADNSWVSGLFQPGQSATELMHRRSSMHKASRRAGIRLAASLIKAGTGVTPRVPINSALVIWAPTTAVSAFVDVHPPGPRGRWCSIAVPVGGDDVSAGLAATRPSGYVLGKRGPGPVRAAARRRSPR